MYPLIQSVYLIRRQHLLGRAVVKIGAYPYGRGIDPYSGSILFKIRRHAPH